MVDRPIRVGAQRIEILAPPSDYAAAFRAQPALILPGLLDPALLGMLLARCRSGRFVEESVAGLGMREVEAPQRVGRALNVLLHRAALLRWIEAATGCGALNGVSGRVVQIRAKGGDALDWHDDLNEPTRRLAVTIDLSDVPYRGGLFELRHATSGAPLLAHRHAAPGDALIFAVRRGLEHRVRPLTDGGPRRVYAGWFTATPRAGA
jgi:hypothetical protein